MGKVQHLSDYELLKQTNNLRGKERQILITIIEHLEEIERRRLYCDLKYSSLFEYCLKELNYSRSQAYRRIDAMRISRAHPEIKEDIKDGALNLSSVNLASSLFKEAQIKNCQAQKAVIGQLIGKTKDESQKIIYRLKEDHGINPKIKRDHQVQVAGKTKRLHINVCNQTVEKLDKLKNLLKTDDMDKLLNKLADIALKEEDQKRKPKRKVAKVGRNNSKIVKKPKRKVKVIASDKKSQEKVKAIAKVSRYIPKSVKNAVYNKANGQCVNCGSTRNLEYEHQIPFAFGGKNDTSNIKLYCKKCNQRKAIKDFGMQRMGPYLSHLKSAGLNNL